MHASATPAANHAREDERTRRGCPEAAVGRAPAASGEELDGSLWTSTDTTGLLRLCRNRPLLPRCYRRTNRDRRQIHRAGGRGRRAAKRSPDGHCATYPCGRRFLFGPRTITSCGRVRRRVATSPRVKGLRWGRKGRPFDREVGE